MEQFDYIKTEEGIRLTGFHGDAVHVTIPEVIGGLPVRVIGTHTFYENGLYVESISVPATVRTIEAYAFEMCLSLCSLQLSEGLETIGAGAFQATDLEAVQIPASVRQIDELAAVPCLLTFAGEPENGNVHSAYGSDGFGIYREDELAGVNASAAPVSYQIREGTKRIAVDVFTDCINLKEVGIPASLTELPEGVLVNVKDPFAIQKGIERVRVAPGNPVYFQEEGMLFRRLYQAESIAIPADRTAATADGIVDFEESKKNPAEGCADSSENGLRTELLRYTGADPEPVIPAHVTRIGSEAFFRTGIRRVTIPASVVEIGADAFLENPLEEALFLNADEKAFCGTDSVSVRGGSTDAEWNEGQTGWAVYFPQSDSYLLKNLLKGFGKNGTQYEFAVYDEILEERHLNLDRVRMMCSRLENGRALPEGKHAVIWAGLLGRMEEIAAMIVEQNDLDLLARLAGHGLITNTNIDRLIRIANADAESYSASREMHIPEPQHAKNQRGAGVMRQNNETHREVLAWLMHYKNQNLGRKTFDFSL